MRFEMKIRLDDDNLPVDGGCLRFWAPDSGGYVYLENPKQGRIGTLGMQICDGGGFMGSTLSCAGSFESLVSVAQRWRRQYLNAVREA